MTPIIDVAGLAKHYQVHERSPGVGAALRSLWHRPRRTVRAVDGIDFSVAPGERVGFLGPNGAGKTTTLKMLAGLLHPTAGRVMVDGFEPRRRVDTFLERITLVMGQKQQLAWDLPPLESFELNRAIYGVPRAQYAATLAELDQLLGLGATVRRPTRQLSLGERMKCELAAALIHRPRLLFLDEPTIGLDVTMQSVMRAFIRQYNERHGATLLLTSHYMDDVAALCPRVIVIDHGRLIYDGTLDELTRTIRPEKRVELRLRVPIGRDSAERLGTVVEFDDAHLVLRVPQAEVNAVVAHALAALPLSDLTVNDPPLEEVMSELFARARPAAPDAAVPAADAVASVEPSGDQP